jgi:hypothetical protein
MKKLLVLAVLALPVVASAQLSEEAAFGARQGFSILSSVRFAPFQKAVMADRSAATLPRQATSQDLESLFVNGTKPAQSDLRGWFAGRRFTQEGGVAALFTGSDIYNDPKQGPIGGSTFKIVLFGADKPVEGFPETYWDTPGSPALDAIASNLDSQSGDWSRADFTADKAVVARKGESSFEVRKTGDWLVVKYPNGDYGYFFKKVR